MTHQARPWSIISAVIDAGQAQTKTGASPEAEWADERIFVQPTRQDVYPPAAILLSQILSGLGSAQKACIQFVACGETAGTPVALATASAAATILGRSLLLDARTGHSAEIDPAEPIPDGFTAGLHHYYLPGGSAGRSLLFGQNRRGAFTNLIGGFQFVAIDSSAPSAGPASSALAPLCTGTILVVQAGKSRHAAIRDTTLHITRAGGRIIGTVLDEVPARKLRWVSR